MQITMRAVKEGCKGSDGLKHHPPSCSIKLLGDVEIQKVKNDTAGLHASVAVHRHETEGLYKHQNR
jgi:hypothetical protein